jgi:hypothetical protein
MVVSARLQTRASRLGTWIIVLRATPLQPTDQGQTLGVFVQSATPPPARGYLIPIRSLKSLNVELHQL